MKDEQVKQIIKLTDTQVKVTAAMAGSIDKLTTNQTLAVKVQDNILNTQAKIIKNQNAILSCIYIICCVAIGWSTAEITMFLLGV